MRKNWKKLGSLVLTAACVLCLSAMPAFAETESTPAYSPVEETTIENLLPSSIQWVGQSLMTYEDAELQTMENSGQTFYERAAKAWMDTREELGNLVSMEDGTVEKDGDFITCTIPAQFEKNPGIVRVFWNISTGTPVPTDLTITVEESRSSLIGQAGMNTVTGIGTVFVVLIFLIFVISAFEPIFGGKKKKAAPKAEEKKEISVPVKTETPAPAPDDLEIQAVISAAIAMYEEEMSQSSGDDYVARPVNRKKNWKRA